MPENKKVKKPFRKLFKKLKNQVAYFLVILALFFFRRIPRSTGLFIVEKLGKLANFIFRKEYLLAKEQLTISLGGEKSPEEIENIANSLFGNIGKNFVDAARIPLMSTAEIKDLCILHNFEVFEEQKKTGRGAVMASSHSGCWELLGVCLAGMGMTIYAISRKLYDERLEKIIVETREKGGMKNISRGKETRDIIRALHNGNFVGILADQDFGKLKGVFVDFFGRPAFTTSSMATLFA